MSEQQTPPERATVTEAQLERLREFATWDRETRINEHDLPALTALLTAYEAREAASERVSGKLEAILRGKLPEILNEVEDRFGKPFQPGDRDRLTDAIVAAALSPTPTEVDDG